jgi:hypothetical protein
MYSLLKGLTSVVLTAMCASVPPLKGTVIHELYPFISNKAVADGAVSFYIDHFVSARLSRFAYGVEILHKYDICNPEHKRRKNMTYMTCEGYLALRGIFNVIVPQVRDQP